MRRLQNEDWYAAKTLPKESLTHFAILSQYFSILSKIPQNAQKISVKAMNILRYEVWNIRVRKANSVRMLVWIILASSMTIV